MELKKLIIVGLFLAIGAVLHAIVPGFFFGMKPDLMLVLLFLALYFFADYKSFLAIGLAAGILGALTTSMPAGQIPSVIDKFTTTVAVFFAYQLIASKMAGKTKYFTCLAISFLGTALSGAIFLGSMILLMNAPLSFPTLYLALVLPTAAFNMVCVAILYPIIIRIARRSQLIQSNPKSLTH
ncbi:tryptophan transporter [Sporolactobacillus sp. THM19-2]|jgi:hypothetical protein|uniref:tryptophan transporter n=1 Tax=Sporolactobacillus sp. THM19-2 TaxID=2511171 RepID=UPI001021C4DA|nr:tryptophan transporter [Sporolactobacillus sp. THM19-2]RYL94508.1 tryptophan transporter [Sporolactobacillus sp. THM19-2]